MKTMCITRPFCFFVSSLLYSFAFSVCYPIPDVDSILQPNEEIWQTNDYANLKRDQNWTLGTEWSFETEISVTRAMLSKSNLGAFSMPSLRFRISPTVDSSAQLVQVNDVVGDTDGVFMWETSPSSVKLTNNLFCFPPRLHEDSSASPIEMRLGGVACLSGCYAYCQDRKSNDRLKSDLLSDYIQAQSDIQFHPIQLDLHSYSKFSHPSSSVTTTEGMDSQIIDDVSISVPHASSLPNSPSFLGGSPLTSGLSGSGGKFIWDEDHTSPASPLQDAPGTPPPVRACTPRQTKGEIPQLHFDFSKINAQQEHSNKDLHFRPPDSPRPVWNSRCRANQIPDHTRLIVIPERVAELNPERSSELSEGSTHSSVMRPEDTKRKPGKTNKKPVGFE